MTFWGTGNPNPGWNADSRSPGDNLYSDSVVALDTDTGKLKWYYQFTPTDVRGCDSVQIPVLANINWQATFEGTFIAPAVQGGTNWYLPSYSPRTGLFYVSTWQNYFQVQAKAPAHWVEGERYTGQGHPPSVAVARQRMRVSPAYRTEQEGYGTVMAIDPQTGDKKWEFKMVDYPESGVLTTASGEIRGQTGLAVWENGGRQV